MGHPQRQGQQQIPFGDDNQKGKGRGNGNSEGKGKGEGEGKSAVNARVFR